MRSWMIGLLIGSGVVSLMPSLLPVWLSVSLLIPCAFVLRGRTTAGCFVSGLFAGLLIGQLHGYDLLARRVAPECESRALTVEGQIVSLPARSLVRKDVWQQRFEFRLSHLSPLNCAGPERVQLTYYGDQLLEPGQHWRFQVALKRPWGLSNPGSFNIQAWYAASGIDAVGSVAKQHAKHLSGASGNLYHHHSLRLAIGSRIDQLAIPQEARSLLKTITVADKSGISSSTWSVLRQYGVNHLFVISGLHIGLSAGAGYGVGNVLARLMFLISLPRIALYTAPTLALSVAFFYTALAGFSLSAVRALLMLTSFVLASLVGRASLSWNNLLIACVLIMVINPLAILGSGFWLSFTAVATLLWLGMWRSDMTMLKKLAATHVYMAMLMIPMGGFWFGGASQLSAMANALAVPVVGFLVVPLSLLAVVLFLLGLPGDDFLWSVAAWPLEYGIKLVELTTAGDTDAGYWHFTPTPVVVLLALLALALLIVPLSNRLRWLIPVFAAPVFLPQVGLTAHKNILATITILDVGQGTAVVVQSTGKTLVYDTGGGNPRGNNLASQVVLPFLRYNGVRELNTLMVSHPDNDHSAGVEQLQRAMPITTLLVGGNPRNYFDAAPCVSGAAWQWSPLVRFQVMAPSHWEGETTNNSSCVLMLYAGEFRMMLAGDIDTEREQELVLYWRDTLKSEGLLAAHHGSLSSSSSAWLKAVKPDFLVFSNGYLNRFGHPHPDIVERSRYFAHTQYSTALNGAVTITIARDGQVQASGHREANPRYWR